MKLDRRKFTGLLALAALDAACGGSRSPDSPLAPSPVAPPTQSLYPSETCWGTRIGGAHTAQVGGTISDAMTAARQSPAFRQHALLGQQLVSFDGNSPALGLIVLVRGQYFASSMDQVRVAPGDTYAVYRFSGRHRTGSAGSGGVTVDTCG